MERFFNLNQINNPNKVIKKRKPSIRISVQLDEKNLENNVISFKDLFKSSTYVSKSTDEREDQFDIKEDEHELEEIDEEFEEDISEEDVLNDEEESEEETSASIMKNNQPIDLQTALDLRNTIQEEEKMKEFNNIFFNQKKRKIYETYDKNDPFIDDSEDYIMKDTSSKIYNENKNFVVWSGSYNETTKRKRCEKVKRRQLKVNNNKINNDTNNKVDAENNNENISDDDDDNEDQFISTLYPLDPKLEELMNKLKFCSDNSTWNNHDTIPENVLPLFKNIIFFAEKYNYLNNNFYGHLRLCLKHRFNENIPFLKNIIKILLIEEKIKNIINHRTIELDILKNSINEYKTRISNELPNKKKYSWNDKTRNALYNFINFQLQLNELDIKKQKLKSKCENNNDDDFDFEYEIKTKKQICERLTYLWPTLTMKTATLLKEFNHTKNKREKLQSHSLKSINRKIMPEVDVNIYEIKIFEKSDNNNDDLLLPRFIKASSKFYPNHNKHYQRKVNTIGRRVLKHTITKNNPVTIANRFGSDLLKRKIYKTIDSSLNKGINITNSLNKPFVKSNNNNSNINIDSWETDSTISNSESIITSTEERIIKTPVMNIPNNEISSEKILIANSISKRSLKRRNLPSKKESLKMRKRDISGNSKNKNSTGINNENTQPLNENIGNTDIGISRESSICEDQCSNASQETVINKPININSKPVIAKDKENINENLVNVKEQEGINKKLEATKEKGNINENLLTTKDQENTNKKSVTTKSQDDINKEPGVTKNQEAELKNKYIPIRSKPTSNKLITNEVSKFIIINQIYSNILNNIKNMDKLGLNNNNESVTKITKNINISNGKGSTSLNKTVITSGVPLKEQSKSFVKNQVSYVKILPKNNNDSSNGNNSNNDSNKNNSSNNNNKENLVHKSSKTISKTIKSDKRIEENERKPVNRAGLSKPRAFSRRRTTTMSIPWPIKEKLHKSKTSTTSIPKSEIDNKSVQIKSGSNSSSSSSTITLPTKKTKKTKRTSSDPINNADSTEIKSNSSGRSNTISSELPTKKAKRIKRTTSDLTNKTDANSIEIRPGSSSSSTIPSVAPTKKIKKTKKTTSDPIDYIDSNEIKSSSSSGTSSSIVPSILPTINNTDGTTSNPTNNPDSTEIKSSNSSDNSTTVKSVLPTKRTKKTKKTTSTPINNSDSVEIKSSSSISTNSTTIPSTLPTKKTRRTKKTTSDPTNNTDSTEIKLSNSSGTNSSIIPSTLPTNNKTENIITSYPTNNTNSTEIKSNSSGSSNTIPSILNTDSTRIKSSSNTSNNNSSDSGSTTIPSTLSAKKTAMTNTTSNTDSTGIKSDCSSNSSTIQSTSNEVCQKNLNSLHNIENSILKTSTKKSNITKRMNVKKIKDASKIEKSGKKEEVVNHNIKIQEPNRLAYLKDKYKMISNNNQQNDDHPQRAITTSEKPLKIAPPTNVNNYSASPIFSAPLNHNNYSTAPSFNETNKQHHLLYNPRPQVNPSLNQNDQHLLLYNSRLITNPPLNHQPQHHLLLNSRPEINPSLNHNDQRHLLYNPRPEMNPSLNHQTHLLLNPGPKINPPLNYNNQHRYIIPRPEMNPSLGHNGQHRYVIPRPETHPPLNDNDQHHSFYNSRPVTNPPLIHQHQIPIKNQNDTISQENVIPSNIIPSHKLTLQKTKSDLFPMKETTIDKNLNNNNNNNNNNSNINNSIPNFELLQRRKSSPLKLSLPKKKS